MKRIKQINASKNLILEALYRLLLKFDFDAITMTQIAYEANVVRMTLYRHFEAKEDILMYGFELSMKKIASAMDEIENPVLLDLLKLRFLLLKNFEYTELLAKHNRLDKLFQHVGSKFIQNFQNVLPRIEDDTLKSFIGGGIDAITEKWVREGMIEPSEDIAKLVNDYINKLIAV